MAPPSSDVKPPAAKERGDTSLDLQREHPQTAAPDFPAKMSPARDTSDGTGATTNEDVKHADQQSSKVKKTPTLEVPDDLTSIKNEKHLPPSTPLSSAERPDLVDKATDGTPPDPDNPRSDNLISSANKRDSLDDPAGTRSSPQVTSHDAESASSGKTSFIPTNADDISSEPSARNQGNTTVSLVDSPHISDKLDGTGNLLSRKRKEVPSSIDGQLEEAQLERHGRKKLKPDTASFSLTAPQASLVGHKSSASERQETSEAAQKKVEKLGAPGDNKADASSTIRKRAAKKMNQGPPIDRKIRALRSIVGTNGQFVPCRETAPLRGEADLRLDRFVDTLDLSTMESLMGTFLPTGKNPTPLLTRDIICLVFTTNECATVLRQWMLECFNDPEMDEHLPYVLQRHDKRPWLEDMEQLASCAMHYAAIVKRKMVFESDHREAMMSCAKFVRRLVQCISPPILTYLDKCKFLDMDSFFFRFGAGALITVYEDLSNQPGKLFTTLLNSPFATGITSEVRPSWASRLGLKCADEDVRHKTPVAEVQKAALAIGATMQEKCKKQKNVNADKLRGTDKPFAASVRFNSIYQQLHEQADRHPELLISANSQEAIATFPKTLPPKIHSHKKICTMPTCTGTHERTTTLAKDDIAGTVPDPNEDAPLNELVGGHEHFAVSKGRIVPCRPLVPDHGDPDPFTEQEELILYKRFKAVITASHPGVQEATALSATALSSEKWFEFWAKIAEVLPGHGVMDCIVFYIANKEHFQHK